ncbi:MAG TPA: RDD family protein [Pyrinomonadaceae bacterium]|nr:RDD family protein [Pyrinomonadaceae bacterium]
MRCPSCGATYDGSSAKCTECQTGAVNDAAKSEIHSYPLENQLSETTELQELALENSSEEALKEWSSLIQFPAATKSTVPQWRKELSDRVRQIQEQRTREAALAKKKSRLKERRNGSKRAPQLALLESPETPELNPIVAAALRRIDRAHKTAEAKTIPATSNNPKATVPSAREVVPRGQAVPAAEVIPEEVPVPAAEETEAAPLEQRSTTEKPHNLIVVPAAIAKEPEKRVVPAVIAKELEKRVAPAVIANEPEKREQPVRPKRLIGDDLNHPALNYLDSIAQTVPFQNSSRQKASGFRRILSAFVDLVVIGSFASPFVGALYLLTANWRAPMVIGMYIFVVLLVGFLYLTIATALTGRTAGMKLLSLRVIDARTGLIPTGNQSAGRALLYLASLLSVGIALIYAVADSERRPAHDRFTGTAVVRA